MRDDWEDRYGRVLLDGLQRCQECICTRHVSWADLPDDTKDYYNDVALGVISEYLAGTDR